MDWIKEAKEERNQSDSIREVEKRERERAREGDLDAFQVLFLGLVNSKSPPLASRTRKFKRR